MREVRFATNSRSIDSSTNECPRPRRPSNCTFVSAGHSVELRHSSLTKRKQSTVASKTKYITPALLLGFRTIQLREQLGDGRERVLPQPRVNTLCSCHFMDLWLDHDRTRSLERRVVIDKVGGAGRNKGSRDDTVACRVHPRCLSSPA
jgi:hypothetical protein